MNLKDYFSKALKYKDYIKLLDKNLQLHQRHYDNFIIDENEKEIIKNYRKINILVITEPWCGDSLALLPIFKKISELNSGWEIKIVLRDKNVDLIDKFLTNGGRAIPIFLILDPEFKLIFKWGPRPKLAQFIFEQNRSKIEKGEIDKSKVILKIRQYYSQDKGKDTTKEIIEHLNKHL